MTNYQIEKKINGIFNKIFDFLNTEEKTNLDYITLVKQKVVKADSGIPELGVTHFVRDIELLINKNNESYNVFINGASLMNQSLKIKLTDNNVKDNNKIFDFKTKYKLKNASTTKILSTIGNAYQKLSEFPITDIKKSKNYNNREIFINGYELYFDTSKKDIIQSVLNIGIENNILNKEEIEFIEYQVGLKGNWPVLTKKEHLKFNNHFDSVLSILVKRNMTDKNKLIFNDHDNKAYFINSDGVQGIHLQSQTTSFFIAQKDEKIKAWLSPFLSKDWASELESDMSLEYDFKNAYDVDALENLRSYFEDDHYYAVPILFERDDYPKTPEQLILNFDFDNEDYLLYDSDKGFNNSISNIYSRLLVSELNLTLNNLKYI